MSGTRMVTRTAVWLLLVFVPAAALNGSVVAYTNAGGQFTWDTGEYYDSLGEFPGNFLDITQPASQLGARKNGAFGKWWVANIALHDPAPRYMRGEPGAEVAQITDPKLFDWNGGTNNFIAYSLREYGPGERIRSDARWRENAITSSISPTACRSRRARPASATSRTSASAPGSPGSGTTGGSSSPTTTFRSRGPTKPSPTRRSTFRSPRHRRG
ncbi:MAG: hypothetical protein GIKADHBN_00638 [Phycisphaerales bacterium]|nr:hypothetical protein [Phycisphaerales bacterium]